MNYISLLSKVFHGAKRNIMKFLTAKTYIIIGELYIIANEHVFSTARVGLSEATGVVVIYQD